MALTLTDPESVVNAAIGRIGYKLRIGSLFDGTEAAKSALDIYGQTRDEMLRAFDWGFAERDLTLTLQKTAPVGGYTPPTVWTSAYPILPWIYQYAYPGDMLKLRSLRGTPIFIPIFDPKPITFRIANDNSFVPAQKVILSNLSGAIAVYTAQVTDPTTWDASFTEALIAALARRLAPALSTAEAEKMEAQDESGEAQIAEMRIG